MSRRAIGLAVAGVLAAAALFAVVQRLAHTPSKVERVTIVNPTPYDLEVEVSGADRSTGLTLGAVDREQTKTIEDVIDQGDQWVFRFSRGHDAVGDLTLSKDQLGRDHWRVPVPSSVAGRLAAAGAAPSPKP
jgi:hypothetical protein